VLIHLVTDRHRLCPQATAWSDVADALERQAADAAEAGVSVLQLRERDLDAGRLADLAGALQRRVEGSTTVVVINDRADVAMAAGVGGVHLRSHGPDVASVRVIGPRGWVVGRSVHSAPDIAAQQEADYLLFGTMFPSRSKPGFTGQGAQALALAVAAGRVPVVAIGGVTPDRAEACARAGAAGVAAIGLFLPAGREPEALGVRDAVRALREAFARGRSSVE
jgi:thiamine-phosphate pyrophosphorylase